MGIDHALASLNDGAARSTSALTPGNQCGPRAGPGNRAAIGESREDQLMLGRDDRKQSLLGPHRLSQASVSFGHDAVLAQA